VVQELLALLVKMSDVKRSQEGGIDLRVLSLIQHLQGSDIVRPFSTPPFLYVAC
jgi:hypothetical protein